MTRGYLLDTNIIRPWFDENRNPEHELVVSTIDRLGSETPLVTSAVVLGEIEYGYAANPAQQSTTREILTFTRTQLPRFLSVTTATTPIYGRLRGALFDKYAPKKRRKGLRPEQLVHPITSKKLGIQENDLWIAAQAIEHNLVLVTNDDMVHIRTVAPELVVEDWTKP